MWVIWMMKWVKKLIISWAIIAALGVQIRGERLALGINLFSGKEILGEEYGYEKLFEEIDYRSDFYKQRLPFNTIMC
ncbi:MAG: hypothetical protein K6E98_07405 [Lachnospiraceae bacterium]|nr:hypothetical protein [Lachnospiraceae bacterium]